VAAGLVGAAGASTPAKKKPPVKLEGKVENGGTATVKNDAVTSVTDDFLFRKTFLKVKPDTTVTVTLRNDGAAPHTFTAKDGSFDTEVGPGTEATVQVAIPAGNAPVAFFCRFHGASKNASMKGAFFTKKGVKEGAASGSSGPGSTTPSTGLPGYGY
jgi:plastocyanin